MTARLAVLSLYAAGAGAAALVFGARYEHHHGTAPAGHAHGDIGLLVTAAGLAVVPATVVLARRAALDAERPLVVDVLAVVAALLTAGAATIHFAVTWPHYEDYRLFGVLFGLTAIVQLASAPALLVRRSPRLLVAVAVLNTGVLVAWLASRTVGLPVGPHRGAPEAIGLTDATATGLEAALVACALALLRARRGGTLDASGATALTWTVGGLVALAVAVALSSV